MFSLNFPRHKKAAKIFKYDDTLEGLRIQLMHIILKTSPKIHIKTEANSIAWLLKRQDKTHRQYTVSASVLFSQYLISYSGEEG